MINKLKKRKKNILAFQSLIRECNRLFVNNPFDNPKSRLLINDYYSLLKAAEIMTIYHDFPIIKDSQEWSYFSSKWNALHNFYAKDQLKNFKSYHDVFVAIIENWGKLKHNPYTYRCVASLARMLGDE